MDQDSSHSFGDLRGKLFLILGPSGAGKGTVMADLKQEYKKAFFPVSCTTRSPRPGERDGEIYHFVSREEFERRRQAGEFLEWAVVHHDNLYGTLKAPILQALRDGKMVIREVDMQGVESILKILPREVVVSIFLTTSSWEILKARILRRHRESDQELEQRHQSFEKEMAFSKTCDYVVHSEEGKQEDCSREVKEIIRVTYSGVV